MAVKKQLLDVQGLSVSILQINTEDYISLTDIAKFRNEYDPTAIISN